MTDDELDRAMTIQMMQREQMRTGSGRLNAITEEDIAAFIVKHTAKDQPKP